MFSDHVVQVASRAATFRCKGLQHVIQVTSAVRSLMEYCPLTWESCPTTYLNKLENLRMRAQRLIGAKERHEHQQQQHPQGAALRHVQNSQNESVALVIA